MGQVILNWGFPFYLIALEMLFRGISGLDVRTFVGPAIATAGLSFLLPLTKPKSLRHSLNEQTIKLIESNGGVVVNCNDQKILPFIWISILIGFLVWFWASYIALSAPSQTVWIIPKHIVIGFINYLSAAFFSAIKEKI